MRVTALKAHCCAIKPVLPTIANISGVDFSIPKMTLVSSKYLTPLIAQLLLYSQGRTAKSFGVLQPTTQACKTDIGWLAEHVQLPGSQKISKVQNLGQQWFRQGLDRFKEPF